MLGVGSGLCKVTLYLIGFAFIGQILSNFFYTRPNDRLLYLGLAFVLIFALFRVLRAMARQPERASGNGRLRYPPAMGLLKARR